MDCYTRENPEDSDNRVAKFMEFQTFSKLTKKVVLKEAALNYTVSNGIHNLLTSLMVD